MSGRIRRIAGGALATMACAPAAWAQTTWYVDANATPPGAGTPGEPYASLQYAIAQGATLDGDTVLVLPGTYSESVDFLGKGLEVRSAAGAAVTVLRGDPAADPPRSVVTFANGESSAARLEGFTVREGNGTLAGSVRQGGGLLVLGASPQLVGLVVEENEADEGHGMYLGPDSDPYLEECMFRDNGGDVPHGQGGGMYGDHAQPTFVRCEFRANRAEQGGGVYGVFNNQWFQSCVFAANEAATEGGAMYLDRCDGPGFIEVQLKDCTLDGNFAGERGGALLVWNDGLLADGCLLRANRAPLGGGIYADTALVELGGCEFRRNQASQGGAAHVETCIPAIFRRCSFVGNGALATSANSFGGGALSGGLSRVSLLHCLFDGNVAEATGSSNQWGGAVTLTDCHLYARWSVFRQNRSDRTGGALNYFAGGPEVDADIRSCTFWGNRAEHGGDAVRSLGLLEIVDSIVWANGADPLDLGALGIVTWSDVEGGFPGAGNLDRDPACWDPEAGDFFLKPGSPCIDAGDPTHTDPDGSRVDMGARAFDPDHCAPPRTYCVGRVDSDGCAARIGYEGSPTLDGPDDFVLTATELSVGRMGALVWSLSSDELPFGGGTLCVATPWVRAPIQSSSGGPSACSGSFVQPITQAEMNAHGLEPGTTVFAQFLYRDPGFVPPENLAMSAGLRFSICP